VLGEREKHCGGEGKETHGGKRGNDCVVTLSKDKRSKKTSLTGAIPISGEGTEMEAKRGGRFPFSIN